MEINEWELLAYREKRHAVKGFAKFGARLKGLARASSLPALGFDISAWQTSANFVVAKGQGLEFAWIRALYGLTEDAKFAQHWNASHQIMPRGPYLYYKDALDPLAQAQKLYDLIVSTGKSAELPPMLDIEEYGNATLTASRIKQCLEKLEQLFGKKPVVYTGYYVWRDAVTGDKAWAVNYPLVIAAYPLTGWQENYPTLVLQYPPLIPAPWTKYFAWQWTAYAPAGNFGVSGNVLDLDYASPEMEALYLNDNPPPIGEARMINFKTLYTLYTRAEGKYGSAITGSLPVNTVFPALDVNVDTATSVWLKYAENKWVALVHGGGKYCQRESVTPCTGENVPMTPEQEQLLHETAEKVTRLAVISPTHRVHRPTGSMQIKGRGVEAGEEFIDLPHGTLMEYVRSQDSSKYVRIMIGVFPHFVAIAEADWTSYVVEN